MLEEVTAGERRRFSPNAQPTGTVDSRWSAEAFLALHAPTQSAAISPAQDRRIPPQDTRRSRTGSQEPKGHDRAGCRTEERTTATLTSGHQPVPAKGVWPHHSQVDDESSSAFGGCHAPGSLARPTKRWPLPAGLAITATRCGWETSPKGRASFTPDESSSRTFDLDRLPQPLCGGRSLLLSREPGHRHRFAVAGLGKPRSFARNLSGQRQGLSRQRAQAGLHATQHSALTPAASRTFSRRHHRTNH